MIEFSYGYANSIYTIAVGATGDQVGVRLAGTASQVPTCSSPRRRTAMDRASPRWTSPARAATMPAAAPATTGTTTTRTISGARRPPVRSRRGAWPCCWKAGRHLGWRDVKGKSCSAPRRQSPADTGWFNNGAGYHFNDKLGAGLVDVKAAIDLAAAWVPAKPRPRSPRAHTALGAAIPDGSGTGTVQTFTVPAVDNARTEQVTMSVDISHTIRGQLEILLTSPSGTTSRLIRPRSADAWFDPVWKMSTPQFWGENSAGLWSLRVRDTVSGATGTQCRHARGPWGIREGTHARSVAGGCHRSRGNRLHTPRVRAHGPRRPP